MVTSPVREVVARVTDPEIPGLTIDELGVLRDVSVDGERVVVTITPTYTGCPAMRQIETDIRRRLLAAGYDDVLVKTVYEPAWGTDWISDRGLEKLSSLGIAPPGAAGEAHCPSCSAGSPRLVSEFGPTPCKALMVCRSCGDPFDLFKQL